MYNKVLGVGGGGVEDGQWKQQKTWTKEAEETIISVLNQNRIKSEPRYGY